MLRRQKNNFLQKRVRFCRLVAFNAVVTDSSNNVYVAGQRNNSSNVGQSVLLFKFNSSGTVQFAKELTVSGGSAYACGPIKLDSSANIYVAGNVTISGNGQSIIWKLDSSGNLSSTITDSASNGNMNIYDMFIDSSNNIFTTAFIASYYQLTKWNTSLAVQSRPTAISYGSTAGNSVTGDADGNIYVGGWTFPSDRYLGFITKYDSSLTISWERSFRPTQNIVDWEFTQSALLLDGPAPSLLQTASLRRSSLAISGTGIMRVPLDGSKTQNITFAANSAQLGSLDYTTGLSKNTQTNTYTVSSRTGSASNYSYSTTSYTYTLGDISVTNGVVTYT